ncbi:MAG: hypothetical protein LBO20_00160 [Bifidobacteriaceae bacterium]|nr:hypothetical protein [Bifidobacteriaceae bacterium]
MLGTVAFTGGALSPAPPAAEAAGLPTCTNSVWGYIGSFGVHRPGTSAGSYSCKNTTANVGQVLDSVKVIQNAANGYYDYNLTKDGKYGALTAGAVGVIQQLGGVSRDYEYGPVTCGVTFWPVQTKPAGSPVVQVKKGLTC